jgi:hypothetical protein
MADWKAAVRPMTGIDKSVDWISSALIYEASVQEKSLSQLKPLRAAEE